jgi:hypothetical protein
MLNLGKGNQCSNLSSKIMLSNEMKIQMHVWNGCKALYNVL